MGKVMEEDYTSVYLKGVYDERDKWESKVKEKIKELTESMNKAKPFDISYIEYCEDRIEVLQELLEE